ncbi:TIGR04376 family protein [Synechococcales cyanobacterium C]|uniref:TIGR04376 family protein n=1 Tax=Petrachloros mirabilis ULC683 TaxID=2781853 RepID=A0A8K1ZXC2_9CYAN|nr:TIGR04376 family protein [Petrachloros mirabilis]NCJ06618.1 TIGR04376 family protein [Petrachloros mirabilis ULC683]
MSVFDDVSRFLEERLDEFLQANPHLELQVLDDKLQEQEVDTLRLLKSLQVEEQQQQAAILATAQEIQRWHPRIQKAEVAGRPDLAKAARERETALLRQGNQQWGQMEVLRQRIQQTQTLHQDIQKRRQEVVAKRRANQTAAGSQTSSQPWTSGSTWTSTSAEPDPLETQFKQWEMESELEELKRKMNR